MTVCVMWLIHMWGRDSSIRGTWLLHVWEMTHDKWRCRWLYAWRDPCMCGTWLIYTWDMTHLCVGHDSFICGTWLMISEGVDDCLHNILTICVCVYLSGMTPNTHSFFVHKDPLVQAPFIHETWLIDVSDTTYGVATISRLLKIIGPFCRMSSLL